ncbi:MAG TPA: pyruvate dehydrogenase complex dihydrolipoamide acetyltransferase [Aliiroseovarius sp.]|nr:pyruvate dehydrogenase complex dihydrolipoamide acetyltransferase [Aliiroseovarius sp.]
MPIEILMPALSPTMEEGKLAKWLVKEGDSVNAGDLLAEIETDKAVMEFEATEDGVVGRLLVPEGAEAVAVNTPIAVLLEEGEAMGDYTPGAAAPAETAPASPAPTSPDRAEEAAPTGEPSGAPTGQAAEGKRIFASPLARRIAAQKGLDLARITGTGPNGRIVKADVEAAVAKPKKQVAPQQSARPAPLSPQVEASAIERIYEGREYTEIPLDGMRKTIAARLTEAKQTIPHFYLRRDIRLDALLAFRAQINAELAPREIKLSVNDFIIKACALALQQVPDANAVWAGDRLLRLKPSDVAVAVAIEGGLFTPVIQDADKKTLSAISAEMKDLAARARTRRLAPHEYQGGAFAISNLGMFGIDNFDAVINPPHGSILAVGAGVKKPVVEEDGCVGVATVMSVTLSCDHRVIDGALGAEFLAAIKANLEAPLAMLA